MATMVEVARLAHVSTSTVSHVVNGTRPVAAQTRQRVVDAMEALSYRHDALARALRRNRTDSIGLVIPDASEPAFAQMIRGVEDVATANGLTLLLATSHEDPGRELGVVRSLTERRVDGLILARCSASAPETLEILRSRTPPTVLLDRIFDDVDLDQVGTEGAQAMTSLVTHLRSAGHRRFLLLAGDTSVPTLRERRQGFISSFPLAELMHQEVAESDQTTVTATVNTAFSRKTRPTCVITSSTPLAAQALRALGDMGLSTPQDVAFATFDGFDHADLFSPQLTTVIQSTFEMGRCAARLLVEHISEDHEPIPARTVRLHHTLLLRASTEQWRPRASRKDC